MTLDPETILSEAVGVLLIFVFALALYLASVGDRSKKYHLLKSALHQSNGRAGDNLRRYRAKRNVNRVINWIMTGEKKAFPQEGAAVIQQKKYPDVSFYQGIINWDKMRAKTDAIILRAGQNTWPDSMFLINYEQAKKCGMLRGVYFFYDDRVSPGKQASTLIELIADDLPEMEVFVDWETTYGGAYGGLKNVVAFMQAIEKALAVRTGIYTGYYWFVEHTNALLNWSQYQYLKDKPLWLAYYADASAVKIPAPWTDLLLWQFGTPAEDWGQSSYEIDMSYFNGSIADFYRHYEVIDDLPIPETELPMSRYEATAPTLNDLALRPDHNTNNTALEYLPKGCTIYGNELWICAADNYVLINGANVLINKAGDKWLKVMYISTGAAKVGWSAIIHKGQTICTNLIDYGVITPAPELPPRVALSLDGISFKWYIPE